jgi:glycosyltransferase involved in cell wall biosynthesis
VPILPQLPRPDSASPPPELVLLASFAPSLWNFRSELVGLLVQGGYRVTACAPPHPEASQRMAALGARFLPLGPRRTSANPLADLHYLLQVLKLCRRVRPAALIAYTAKPVIWGCIAAGRARVPRIVALITGLGFAFTAGQRGGGVLPAAVRALYRVALRRCSAVAFQNPDDRREFIERGLLPDDSRSFVVNGSGVDLARFAPVRLPEEPVFLLIARLLRDKGIREFCEAARSVRQQRPAARFRIVGWFDDNPSAITAGELAQWCADVVDYRGPREDVRDEIAAARIYVLPSYREGTPRTVLEAMSMGRPIITTDVPGCREAVRDGWNGLLVPARDPDALAAAMVRLCDAPEFAATLGAHGRALAEAKYDATAVARAVLAGAGLP